MSGARRATIADSTRTPRDAETTKASRNSDNISTVLEIQNAFVAGCEPLLCPGRLFIMEGMLSKLCRKGMKQRQFFLFNDILVYGAIISRGRYSRQRILPVTDLAVLPLEERGEAPYGMQFNHRRKSFQAYAKSQAELDVWLPRLRRTIEKASGRNADAAVAARPIWVPDVKASKCMVCLESDFTVMRRRHHCRNCGKVVCGPCSHYRAYLLEDFAERVCVQCYTEIETYAGTAPAAAAKHIRGEVVLQDVNDESCSNSSDSSDDDVTDDVFSGDPAPPSSMRSRAASAVVLRRTTSSGSSISSHKAATAAINRMSLTEGEKLLHAMSDDERIAIMSQVKEGSITIDEAMARIDRGIRSGEGAVLPKKKPLPARTPPARRASTSQKPPRPPPPPAMRNRAVTLASSDVRRRRAASEPIVAATGEQGRRSNVGKVTPAIPARRSSRGFAAAIAERPSPHPVAEADSRG